MIVLVTTLSSINLAQSNGKPPQILTSDLMRKQIIETPTILVTFVFIDNDNITYVEINGEEEDITPDKTIVVRKKFTFFPGRTLIKVKAIDEHGLEMEKHYLVGFETEDEGLLMEEDKKDSFFWSASINLKYEYDDNPTNDASLPIKVGDLDLQGVIDDDEQPDYRKVFGGTLSAKYGSFSTSFGGIETTYNKPDNDFLNSRAIFIGLGFRTALTDSIHYQLNYLYLDININKYDYSSNQKIDTGFQFANKDSDGYYNHYLGISYLEKDFAAADQEKGSQSSINWTYDSLDAESLDLFRSNIAYGNSSDGNEDSEFTYSNWDFDWFNRWEAGFKWDLGFGFQQRQYKYAKPLSTETPFGEKRVDIPIRFSNGFGWHFNDKWQAMFNYRYVFNLSNKSPYVRTIYGLSVNGTF
jgi:hypothetical protein